MSKHTPGPWEVRQGKEVGNTVYVSSDKGQICTGVNGFESRIPNARLIAAAPELLEALEVAEKALTAIFKAINLCVLENADEMNIIRAAIAKATQPVTKE